MAVAVDAFQSMLWSMLCWLLPTLTAAVVNTQGPRADSETYARRSLRQIVAYSMLLTSKEVEAPSLPAKPEWG